MNWINILGAGQSERDGEVRASSLGISKRSPGALTVVGNLPHYYEFWPASGDDRDKLVKWLNGLDYGGGGGPLDTD